MIKLYQFQPVWDLPNASAFCMKLETYLKMANIPYETIIVNSPSKGPKPKLPNLSTLLRGIAPDLVRKRFLSTLDRQGIGRHSREEIYSTCMNERYYR